MKTVIPPWSFEQQMAMLEVELALARERWKRLPERRVRLRMANVLLAITDDVAGESARREHEARRRLVRLKKARKP